jgi:carbamoylphosphate synthase small subunit
MPRRTPYPAQFHSETSAGPMDKFKMFEKFVGMTKP